MKIPWTNEKWEKQHCPKIPQYVRIVLGSLRYILQTLGMGHFLCLALNCTWVFYVCGIWFLWFWGQVSHTKNLISCIFSTRTNRRHSLCLENSLCSSPTYPKSTHPSMCMSSGFLYILPANFSSCHSLNLLYILHTHTHRVISLA